MTSAKLALDVECAGIRVFNSGVAWLQSPSQVIALMQHLRRHQYDIIHVHLFPAQLWTAIAAMLACTKCPLITTEHSTWNRRRKPLLRPLDQWLYRRYRAVICITEAVRASLQEWLRQDCVEFTVIPNGINLSRFTGGKVERSSDAREPVILAVGSLRENKDHATLLRAAALLGLGQVVIVGSGELLDSLSRLRDDLHIGDRVRFLGLRDDIPELMAAADIYVQPSRVEGFGIAPLEAMATGLPVIVSDVPGMRAVVKGACLTFPAGDAGALAKCLKAVISNPQLRDELSRAGQRRAELFSVDRTVEGYGITYEAVLLQRALPPPRFPGI